MKPRAYAALARCSLDHYVDAMLPLFDMPKGCITEDASGRGRDGDPSLRPFPRTPLPPKSDFTGTMWIRLDEYAAGSVRVRRSHFAHFRRRLHRAASYARGPGRVRAPLRLS